MTNTLYAILGITENATAAEIKDAYRSMAMKWHPDRNPDNRVIAEEKFKEASAAYKTLYNPVSREEYDKWLREQKQNASSQSYKNESDISEEDAEKLFFESMLDLAVEIAKRGYDTSIITKTLVGLDCPESVAKLLAVSAIKIHAAGDFSNASDASFTSEDATDRTPNYAGFWRRFAAAIIDSFIFAIPFIILQAIATGGDTLGPKDDGYWGWVLVGSFLFALYDAYLLSARGATIGRSAVGISVIDLTHGTHPSLLKAFIRFYCRYLSFLTLYVGFLIQIFTNRRQTLHDLILHTVVVKVEDKGKWLIYVCLGAFLIGTLGVMTAVAIPLNQKYQENQARVQIFEGVEVADIAEKYVVRHLATHKTVPSNLNTTGFNYNFSENISEVGWDPQIKIVFVKFSSKASHHVANKHLIFRVVTENNQVKWECLTQDINEYLLPDECSFLSSP